MRLSLFYFILLNIKIFSLLSRNCDHNKLKIIHNYFRNLFNLEKISVLNKQLNFSFYKTRMDNDIYSIDTISFYTFLSFLSFLLLLFLSFLSFLLFFKNIVKQKLYTLHIPIILSFFKNTKRSVSCMRLILFK